MYACACVRIHVCVCVRVCMQEYSLSHRHLFFITNDIPDEFFNLYRKKAKDKIQTHLWLLINKPCSCLSKQFHLNYKKGKMVMSSRTQRTQMSVHTYSNLYKAHTHQTTIFLLTTLVVPDCMSGKKAGLTWGATGRGGATIGNPTTRRTIMKYTIASTVKFDIVYSVNTVGDRRVVNLINYEVLSKPA